MRYTAQTTDMEIVACMIGQNVSTGGGGRVTTDMHEIRLACDAKVPVELVCRETARLLCETDIDTRFSALVHAPTLFVADVQDDGTVTFRAAGTGKWEIVR
jgi:hypothetical protein